MDKIEHQIIEYWDKRAVSYTDVIKKNLEDTWEEKWANELTKHFPQNNVLSILDIGTGPGFYSIILAKRGFKITAIDSSEEMLNEAKFNAGKLAENIQYFNMNAQRLDFPSNSFDAIVTRNLTWNLPEPSLAYSEWYRVLKPNGVLLNFDANWYSYMFDSKKRSDFINDRHNVSKAGVEDHESYPDSQKMEQIALMLPLGRIKRPAWDLEELLKIGFSKALADTEIGNRVWNPEEKLNYASTPGFMIKAVK